MSLWFLIAGGAVVRAEDQRSPTVGVPARIERLVLPGTELVVKPLDDRRTPVVVRIVNVYPHGTAFRYDLEYYGLQPGKFDLKEYLHRKDGSSIADLPSIPVEIRSVLPPGQIEPNTLEAKGTPFLGGYRLALLVGGALWVLGLLAILFVGRRRKKEQQATARRPLTLADRLRPLVQGAMAGKLTTSQRAELERTLLSYWSRRLGLFDRKPSEVIAMLRAHPEAGPLILQLEAWLHRPGTGSVDVTALLAPYQSIPADTLEMEVRSA